MGIFRKYVKTAAPDGLAVGRELEFRPMGATVARGKVLEVHEKMCVIEILWCSTGIYATGKDYEIKYNDRDWMLVIQGPKHKK